MPVSSLHITGNGNAGGESPRPGLLARMLFGSRGYELFQEVAEIKRQLAALAAQQPVLATLPPVMPGPSPAAVEQPAPAAAAQPDPNQDLAQVLSPSQVSTWLDCPAKWFFRYFRELPDITNANRALGKAVHAAIAANFRHKLEAKQDLEREALLEVYATAWTEEAKQATFAPDDDKTEIGNCGMLLVQKFFMEAAASIQPMLVEHPIAGAIAGVKVRGILDLIDTDGVIVDFKTSSKKPSAIEPGHVFQLATYTQITPGASGRAACKTLVKTKTPQLVNQPYEVTDQDRKLTENLFPLVQEAARTGIYCPNRGAMFCSRAQCSFWQACEQEYGGTVPEK